MKTQEQVRTRPSEAGAASSAYSLKKEGGATVSGAQRAPGHEEIAARAKAIWLAKGCPEGKDDENWREAETQLKAEAQASTFSAGDWVGFHEEEDGKILVIHASGKLSREDYDHFVPEMERLIRRHGQISILFEMHDFHGWEAGALWEDTKFAMRHFRDIKRAAIVGERRWQNAMAHFCRPFTKAEVRYFDHAQLATAHHWVQTGTI